MNIGTGQLQIQELQANFNFLRACATQEGFFKLYFNALPAHRTQVECFNHLNDRYFDLVGEYRYSGYETFKVLMGRYRKNKKEAQ
jgi:hypothetical protein